MEKGAAQAPTSDKTLSSLAGGGGEGSRAASCLLEASLSREFFYTNLWLGEKMVEIKKAEYVKLGGQKSGDWNVQVYNEDPRGKQNCSGGTRTDGGIKSRVGLGWASEHVPSYALPVSGRSGLYLTESPPSHETGKGSINIC